MNAIPPTGCLLPPADPTTAESRTPGVPAGQGRRRRAGVVCYNPTRANLDQPEHRQRRVHSIHSISIRNPPIANKKKLAIVVGRPDPSGVSPVSRMAIRAWTCRPLPEPYLSCPTSTVREHLARQGDNEFGERIDLAIHRDRSAMLLRDDIVGDYLRS